MNSTHSTAGATFSAISIVSSRWHGRLPWWWCLFIPVVDQGTGVTKWDEKVSIRWHPNVWGSMNELGLALYVLDYYQNTL